MNVSDFIVNELIQAGVEDCFSMVGGHSLFLNRALHASPINVTYMHNEQSMTMAADSYYRVSGKPAVANVTAGPAALNCLNGVYGAYVDAVPMIVLSGQPKQSNTIGATGLPLRQYGDQEFGNIIEVVKPITKFAIQLSDLVDVQAVVSDAIAIAVEGKPGPVWIDVPMDIQDQTLDLIRAKSHRAQNKNNYHIRNKSPSPKTLQLVFQHFKTARRPVIYLGAGVSYLKEKSLLRNFLNRLGAPVVTAWNGHDVIESDDALFCGRPGLRGERSGNFVVYASDFILALGTRLSHRQVGGGIGEFAPNAFTVLVNEDIHELYKPHLEIDLPIYSKPEYFLRESLNFFGSDQYRTEARDRWTSRAKLIHTKAKPKRSDYPEKEKINPYHFLFDFFDVVPEGAVIICGNGISVVGAFQVAKVKKGQMLFQNTGCASMGYDLPATVGAVTAGAESVYCLTGDGSVQLNIQELSVISSLANNVKIFVINNNGYDSIRQSQKNLFGEYSDLHGVSENTGLSFPCLEKISEAYKFNYTCISKENYNDTFSKDFLKKGNEIIEIICTDDQPFEPKVGVARDGAGQISSGSLINMNPYFPEGEDFIAELMAAD